MSLLVVGSIAYDNIVTPRETASDLLGGSAVYFSLAASLFAPVRLVGAVGEDFDRSHARMLAARGVDTAGLEVVSGGKTFRWTGEYSEDMNQRRTLSVELNVLEGFQPRLPAGFRDSRAVFLANGPVVTQHSVLDQLAAAPDLVVADTMDLWIETERAELERLLRRIDGLVVNDSEALLLSGCHGLIEAGRRILAMGPGTLVVKKGEHGAILFRGDRVIPLPAYPTPVVVDPTGAGDSFAGAMMGSLAAAERIDEAAWKRAVAQGAVAASFTVESFGTARLGGVSAEEARRRFDEYCGFLRIE